MYHTFESSKSQPTDSPENVEQIVQKPENPYFFIFYTETRIVCTKCFYLLANKKRAANIARPPAVHFSHFCRISAFHHGSDF